MTSKPISSLQQSLRWIIDTMMTFAESRINHREIQRDANIATRIVASLGSLMPTLEAHASAGFKYAWLL